MRKNNSSFFFLRLGRSSSLNKTTSQESHIYLRSDKIEIIRLTLEDLKQSDKKSSPKLIEKREDIVSPIYETIDDRRDSIDLIKPHAQLETLC